MIEITLPPDELFHAGMAGFMRNCKGIAGKYKHIAGYVGTAWENHIEGALGEFAAAKYLGLSWSAGVDAFTYGDIGRIQVRTSRNQNLIIRPKDADESIYIAVQGFNPPTYQLLGWLYAWEGKQDQFWEERQQRPGAWFVPARALRPMEELRELIRTGEVQDGQTSIITRKAA